MWIEIVDINGVTIGAANSECCDLMKIDSQGGAESGALLRSASIHGDVYKSRISYLRLIETITQSELSGLKEIAEVVSSVKYPDVSRANLVTL